ncbi:MAG: S-layer homology domain-containing protein [Oscillospiraceae bacterium]|jgi:hypothetical protein|nr:S-layer homology domain-containing protein [Oscillospiraceae bacterium]
MLRKMTRRQLPMCALALWLAVSAAPAAGAADTVSVAVPTGQTSFTYELYLDESEAYSGAEFGLTLSDETALSFDGFVLGEDVGGAAASPFVTKDKVHYFGFYANTNAFRGRLKVGTLRFTYTGGGSHTIVLTSAQVVRIDGTGNPVGAQKPSPLLTLAVSRAGGSGGDDGGGGSSAPPAGGGSAAPPAAGDGAQIVADGETPLADAAVRSKYFDDVDEHWPWAVSEIDALYEAGVVKGTAPRVFTPAANITRGDFTLMLVRAYALTADVGDNFADVPEDSYYYEAIAVAKALDIARGHGQNFRPRDLITRQDMMVLMDRVLRTVGEPLPEGAASDLAGFADQARISEYARPSAAALVKSGIIKGTGSGLSPLSNTTRAEAAVTLHRALGA